MNVVVVEFVLGYVVGWLSAVWVYGRWCSLGEALVGQRRRRG